MRHKIAVCSFIFLLLVICMNAESKNSQKAETPIFGNASLVIKDQEIPVLVSKALNGSGDAALRLATFYGFVKMNSDQQRYWEQIAAENGNTVAMYNYALLLMQGTNKNDKVRAHFWMKKAASCGDKTAKEYLEAHPEK